ncbi:gem-associated protein 8 [Papilio machaon]|uniref:gem-associated protein 8 n=1 Tax=Papilio machaon TaxID=76193 RepID=UPI001E6649AB|nr:gem-associated protein 8 [Papilio machaon]
MSQQLPDKQNKCESGVGQKKPRRKRKKKTSGNQKTGRKDIRKKNSKLSISMSLWAENFAVASTWQLKHQLAYWKAKAIGLEYENKVLHDIIRKNHYVDDNCVNSEIETNECSENEESGENEREVETYEECNDEMDFEVSEEFIQFLAANAKYKEDARRERELLKAKHEQEELNVTQEKLETSEEKEQKLKELYGNRWQRISAIEVAMQSQFINEIDKDQPMYWPNIPFNFEFNVV